jgi:uncharacterized protein YbjT (DUF2867 family)
LLVTRFSSRANLNTFEFTVILVVGATGYLGGIITRSLLQQSHAVRITLRPNSNHSDLIGLRAKAAHADLKDPDSLPAACKGIDVVITTANPQIAQINTDFLALLRPTVTQATELGVSRTGDEMIVDHADCLHEGVADR